MTRRYQTRSKKYVEKLKERFVYPKGTKVLSKDRAMYIMGNSLWYIKY